jgi:hypothetical protein
VFHEAYSHISICARQHENAFAGNYRATPECRKYLIFKGLIFAFRVSILLKAS